ncbi:MAG: HAMP domain-containing protein, partial [Acidobacteriaceae bacterium]|nr:HAMP domain-containing protein [Acidobacteriaceae bacterium]
DKWFSRPVEDINRNLVDVGNMIDAQMKERIRAQGHWMMVLLGSEDPGVYQRFCREHQIGRVQFRAVNGTLQTLCGDATNVFPYNESVDAPAGTLTLSAALPVDLEKKKAEIDHSVRIYKRLSADRKSFRAIYLLLLLLITLFVLFVATWLARYMASQISTPIAALLDAAQHIRKGDLGYRVHTGAIDELATLVKAFNEMTSDLERNSKELESRRRFTETILESIPTGVISLSGDGKIQRVNRALMSIFPEAQVRSATRLEDLFGREDVAEIRYLINRAGRTSVAGTQIEFQAADRVLTLSLTVAAIGQRRSSGFVLVVEDSSEVLRAQKAIAWNEVARRVAHEIKNPLTPIALCADRIARQIERTPTPDTQRILRECCTTISREVQSVKTLVDEFSQFTRLPAARPVACRFNEIVSNALAVVQGRLDGIDLQLELEPDLPIVNIDPEQFKRVVVNLVDNAAEAMQHSPLKTLQVATRTTGDSVELLIADSGCGISRDDKEKLFLPYFSTKGRGTGLGLAIVNRILSDHNAMIRVEDNHPCGARFVVEVPTMARVEASHSPDPAGVHA